MDAVAVVGTSLLSGGDVETPQTPLFTADGTDGVVIVPARLLELAGSFEHEATLLILLYALRQAARPFARPRPFLLAHAEVAAATRCSLPSVSRGIREAVRRGIIQPLAPRRSGGPAFYEFCIERPA